MTKGAFFEPKVIVDNRDTDSLIAAYQRLSKQINKHNRQHTEDEKLKIIEQIEQRIYNSLIISPQKQEKPDLQNKKRFGFTNLLYLFLLSFGLLEETAGSYLFGSTLLALIPGLTNPWLLVLSIIYTAIDCILFYAFEVSILKESLGLPYSNNNATKYLDTCKKQLNAIIKMNETLSKIDVLLIDDKLYSQYRRFIQIANQELRDKHMQMTNYDESILKKFAKYFVVLFGALSSIASSYYMAHSLLLNLSAGLVGSNFGFAIEILTIIAGLGFYYAMGYRSMCRLVNPDFEDFCALKKNLANFKDTYDDLEKARLIMLTHGQKTMVDVETQTESQISAK